MASIVVNLLYLMLLYLFIPEIKGQVCPPRDVSFELITGYVFTSPDTIVDTRPGVLKIEDCIDACRRNSTCLSVNYETGLCVLFSGSAEDTPGKIFFYFLHCTQCRKPRDGSLVFSHSGPENLKKSRPKNS